MEPSQRPDELTARGLRRLLAEFLRSSGDFDAFCIDMFPQVYAQFSAAMNRTERTSLLIISVGDLALIAERLNEYIGAFEHQHLPTLPVITAIPSELYAVHSLVCSVTPGSSSQGTSGEPNDDTVPIIRAPLHDETPRLPPVDAGAARTKEAPERFLPSLNQLGHATTELIINSRSWKRRWVFRALSGLGLCALAMIWFSMERQKIRPPIENIVTSSQSITQTTSPALLTGPVQPTEDQEDQAILQEAKSEQKQDEGLGLFLSLSTLDALREVIGIFESRPSLEPVIISRKLIDRLQRRHHDSARFQTLIARLERDRRRLPAQGPLHRQVNVALSDDPTLLGKALDDPDSKTRLTAAQRLVWMHFSSSMLQESLRAVAQHEGPEGVLAYGLLRQAGLRAKIPSKLVEMIMHSSEKQRLLLVAALGQWPLEDARPFLAERIEHDESSRVRRQALDSLEEARQNQLLGNGSVAGAEIASEISRWPNDDPDPGVRLRMKLVRRNALQATATVAAPVQSEAPTPERVEVRFTGESLVRFALDGKQYTLPLRILLLPGPYRLSYRSKHGVRREVLMIPRNLSKTVFIPVKRWEQKIPIVR